MKRIILLIILIITNLNFIKAQAPCVSTINLELKNRKGGVFANQAITLTSKDGKLTFNKMSNAAGDAKFDVPCGITYVVSVANYTKKKEIFAENNAEFTQTLNYEADMVEKAAQMAMTDAEKTMLDNYAKTAPDDVTIHGSVMNIPTNADLYSGVNLILTDLDGNPLAGEMIYFKSIKRNLKVTATTDADGKVKLYLFKGDSYTINFLYNKNYAYIELAYSKGSNTMDVGITYLGSKEIERRKKEEDERVKARDKIIKEELAKFRAECYRLKISEEEGRKREIDKLSSRPSQDDVVLKVLNRNKWEDKLIVCDLTGSMSPYYMQLAVWYQLKYKTEKNLQFVFFNDGDNKPDAEKVIGETGGIYYSPAKSVDSLSALMGHVAAMGYGGDCPENNMEALIKGAKLAKSYKEIVMIADNYSPVKDIELLSKFNIPVHVILCGASNGYIGLDYLLIAWKTKGTIHTIESDITNIATMAEGQSIVIGGNTYKIMGGQFVKITKM